MRITKERALEHCKNQIDVRENGRYLPAEWRKVKCGWDALAVKEEGRTAFIVCDGSSWLFEWASNLRVFSKLGFHGGFRRAAVKAIEGLKKNGLKHPLSYYKHIEYDCHSRGVFGVVLACLVWADCHGLDWRNTSMDILFAQYQRFREQFKGDCPTQRVVATGIPVHADIPTAVLFERIADIVDIHFLETEYDFVPDINAPDKGLFGKMLSGRRLYHLKHTKYDLPTAKGVIDHKIEGYQQAINNAPPETWTS